MKKLALCTLILADSFNCRPIYGTDKLRLLKCALAKYILEFG
jgi:hypothetical protein